MAKEQFLGELQTLLGQGADFINHTRVGAQKLGAIRVQGKKVVEAAAQLDDNDKADLVMGVVAAAATKLTGGRIARNLRPNQDDADEDSNVVDAEVVEEVIEVDGGEVQRVRRKPAASAAKKSGGRKPGKTKPVAKLPPGKRKKK